MAAAASQPMRFAACGPLRGAASLPGDKSISHRALMIAALAQGRSRISGLSDGTDMLATIAALRAFGADISRSGPQWDVDGVGRSGLHQPANSLDMGNSGTSARLLLGLAASHDVRARFTGDHSLCRRPMDRVIAPLRRLGAQVDAAPGERLPLLLHGAARPVPIRHETQIASAQVKSALLLAALNTPGETLISEAVFTRDHTELMLGYFGAPIETSHVCGAARIALTGPVQLTGRPVDVPCDLSAAAFLLVAALIVPGSAVRVDNVVLNPTRTGMLALLNLMGAKLEASVTGTAQGELVGSIVASHSGLTGGSFFENASAAGLIARTIDEFPILFVAAAFAAGTTIVTGLSELRYKESDRIGAMAAGLRAIGAQIEESADGLAITGTGGALLSGGAIIDAALDHRVAMAFAIAGLHCREPVTITDMGVVRTSFPGFVDALAELGATPERM